MVALICCYILLLDVDDTECSPPALYDTHYKSPLPLHNVNTVGKRKGDVELVLPFSMCAEDSQVCSMFSYKKVTIYSLRLSHYIFGSLICESFQLLALS